MLVGGGDPSLTSQGLGRLADQARSKGLERVSGRLLFDESIFDGIRSVPQKGISGGPFEELGRLSGLSYESGRSSDPARSAATAMADILRGRGISVSKEVGPGSAPATPAPGALIGEVTSSSLAALSRSTNVFSINFYAEMLLKGIAAAERGVGTTAGGAALVRAFASQAGATPEDTERLRPEPVRHRVAAFGRRPAYPHAEPGGAGSRGVPQLARRRRRLGDARAADAGHRRPGQLHRQDRAPSTGSARCRATARSGRTASSPSRS